MRDSLPRPETAIHYPLFPTAVGIVLFLSNFAAGAGEPSDSLQVVEQARPSFTAESLKLPISLSTSYLVKHCDKHGRFVYRRDLRRPGHTYGAKYNLLRHAGTMYALAMAHARKPEDDILNTLTRASLFLGARLGGVPKAEGALAIWTDPVDMGHKNPNTPRTAKLGGTGLGLVALASLEKIKPKTIPHDILSQMAAFILFMQGEDGSFRSYYNRVADHTWFSSKECIYYPGEAMLGLLLLHDIDPRPRWLAAAAKGMTHLAEKRSAAGQAPSDHWAMLATKKLLAKLTQSPLPGIDSSLLIRHAVMVSENMLSEQMTGPGAGDLAGSFLPQGRTCPTSIRLEGMLAVLALLPAEHADLRSRLEDSVSAGMRFLLSQQVSAGQMAGAIPRAASALPDSPENQAFNQRVGEVRIDYVQHAVSAMIMHEELLAAQQ